MVNSHYHNDHIRGNQVFNDVKIIATQKTKDLIEEMEPKELEWEKKFIDERIETENRKLLGETDIDKIAELNFWLDYYKAIKESFAEYKITLPNYIMGDSLWLKGNKREVLLFSKGRGHTECDMVLWLPEEKILFAGDLLFVESHPWLGDGFVVDWINYLHYLKELNPGKIVPGHGAVGTTEHVDMMISYINQVTAIADHAIEHQLSEEEVASVPIPDEFSNWFVCMNLKSCSILFNQYSSHFC